MEVWSWPWFSWFHTISTRFQDMLGSPIHGKIVKAANDAVRESLEEVAKEIQILSLDKKPNALEKLKRLKAEVHAAERLGFDVKEYKERLAQLESILDEWKEKMDCLAKVRYWMIHACMEMVTLEAEEEKERKSLREWASVFRHVASAPWHRKDDPVKEEEGATRLPEDIF